MQGAGWTAGSQNGNHITYGILACSRQGIEPLCYATRAYSAICNELVSQGYLNHMILQLSMSRDGNSSLVNTLGKPRQHPHPHAHWKRSPPGRKSLGAPRGNKQCPQFLGRWAGEAEALEQNSAGTKVCQHFYPEDHRTISLPVRLSSFLTAKSSIQTGGQIERNIFCQILHSPSDLKGQSCANLKPAAWNFSQVSQMGAWTQGCGLSSPALPGQKQ